MVVEFSAWCSIKNDLVNKTIICSVEISTLFDLRLSVFVKEKWKQKESGYKIIQQKNIWAHNIKARCFELCAHDTT